MFRRNTDADTKVIVLGAGFIVLGAGFAGLAVALALPTWLAGGGDGTRL